MKLKDIKMRLAHTSGWNTSIMHEFNCYFKNLPLKSEIKIDTCTSNHLTIPIGSLISNLPVGIQVCFPNKYDIKKIISSIR